MIFIKIILIAAFLLVFLQDIKERQVYWILFLIIAISSGLLMYSNLIYEQFLVNVSMNIVFVTLLLISVAIYSKIKLNTSIVHTFGLGDGLLFVALVFTFTSVSFLTLFIFSLIFSLLLHLLLKKRSAFNTVPLAGYMSLFFAIAFVGHWFGIITSVYTI